ncbi:MAG TPA: hypothetical protein VGJ05_19350, partial [Fimbriiglobus sp.]
MPINWQFSAAALFDCEIVTNGIGVAFFFPVGPMVGLAIVARQYGGAKMRRITLFLLTLAGAALSAASADAQFFRRRVVYTVPYYSDYTWTSAPSSVVVNSNVTTSANSSTATIAPQVVVPATQTTTTNGQVVNQASYVVPGAVYYSYPYSN